MKKTIVVFALAFVMMLTSCSGIVDMLRAGENERKVLDPEKFNVLSGSENKDLENLLIDFGKKNNIDIDITYMGTLDIMSELNKQDLLFDAVWSSNSIWLYMVTDKQKIKYSKPTSINPIVFGIKQSIADELGFVGNRVTTQDIVNAVNDGKLNFVMPSVTQTNSGASAYLGFLTSLAGNPEVLSYSDLDNASTKGELTKLFSGVTRSSGSDEFIGDMFINGDYDALVNYEASIISINNQLVKAGKDSLYLVYPYDGVSLSDSPFAYIDRAISKKEQEFYKIQNFLLSSETQKKLADTGRRSGYGGLVPYGTDDVFNPDWGIDKTKYISPIKYPSADVIKEALNLYQTELRKPVCVVFCLDYSGSMYGVGKSQLVSAMDYILDEEKAKNDFIQFSDKDIIVVLPFSDDVMDIWVAENNQTAALMTNIESLSPDGGTNIYDAASEALYILNEIDSSQYSKSVVLMTDGQANMSSFASLKNNYIEYGADIPVFSITFGSADTSQLKDISKLSNAKVFDGVNDLISAFKNVRGYN